MKLTDIDYNGLGKFTDQPAGFECLTCALDAAWDYVFTNHELLLRIQHDGNCYAQLDPPSGSLLLRKSADGAPPMHAWIVTGDGAAFSNFGSPCIPLAAPGTEPDEYSCNFTPQAANWHVRNGDWTVDTEMFIPLDAPALGMKVTVTNSGSEKSVCTLMPVVRLAMAPASLAVWDEPHVYQTLAYSPLAGGAAFWSEARNPGGDPSKRFHSGIVTDMQADSVEVALNRFVGHGTWSSPKAIWDGELSIPGDSTPAYGEVTEATAVVGQPIAACAAKRIELAPGESYSFTIVYGRMQSGAGGSLPDKSELEKLTALLDDDARQRTIDASAKYYQDMFAIRRLETPDECLNRYINEYLVMQMYWVFALDRGWPTSVRGSRDTAQDANGIIAMDGGLARGRILEIFSMQRSDGWFLRQYNTQDRNGPHDDRDYVDAGAWVWDLLCDYVCYTRDFDILSEKLPWLDSDIESPLLDHLEQLLRYYMTPDNIGEHGLCKIREGDWNDSVNLAGIEGRGESVMVTCQITMALRRAADLFEHVGGAALAEKAAGFRVAAEDFEKGLLAHALNDRGYFNAVFNDAGNWIFSPADPDGKARINGPANSFAVISGVAKGETRKTVLAALDSLKGPNGWRLFHPPIGDPPIEKLGRIGQGDLAPGLAENGTCYNHGCHGFLGRAAWSAGAGELLYQTIRYMFSYDTEIHPIAKCKKAPYGVVNNWSEATGIEGLGGHVFLSGSISVAMRNAYDGLIGFRPGLNCLVIDPCIRPEWKTCAAEVTFMGGRYRIEIANPSSVECGVKELKLNGHAAGETIACKTLGRDVMAIPIDRLTPGENYTIEVTLG